MSLVLFFVCNNVLLLNYLWPLLKLPENTPKRMLVIKLFGDTLIEAVFYIIVGNSMQE